MRLESMRVRGRNTQAFRESTTGRLAVLLAIGLMSLAFVICRGIRWDENYEFAQIILGQIKPPAGHPLIQYVCNAFSLQTYSAALLLFMTGSPLIVCGVRNFLFMLATIIPVFLITQKLASNQEEEDQAQFLMVAAAAALLVLFGLHLEFDSSYPQFVWPDMFSNGHIGAGYAVFTFYLLLAGHMGAGLFLLGLMPCIHIGQVPPVAVLAAYQVFRRIRGAGLRSVAGSTPYCLAGVGGCFLFWFLRRPFLVSAAHTGNYAVQGDPWPMWRSFVATHDIHRAIPMGNIWLLLGALLIISAAAGFIYRRSGHGEIWVGVFMYTATVAAIVLSIAAVHTILRADTPPVLLMWMPYRLLNHLPILFIAAACAILAQHASGRILLAVILVYCALAPLMDYIVPHEIHSRYLVPSAGMLFLLGGAAFSSLLLTEKSSMKLNHIAPLSGLLFAPFHLFGACCWILGGGMVVALRAHPLRLRLRYVEWAAVGIACIALLCQQAIGRQNLPIPAYARAIHDFCQESAPDAVFVAPPDQLLLQAQTGHAVLSDMVLPFMITYLPAIGPTVEQMYNDIYGISFLPEPRRPLSSDMKAWQSWWAKLTPEQWLSLSAKYAFDFVIAPSNLSLTIPRVLTSGRISLYQLPEAAHFSPGKNS